MQDMVDAVHHEDSANILTFFIYLSKDAETIQTVLDVASGIFDEFQPCDFDSNVKFVNDLYTRYNAPSPLILPASQTPENRDTLRRGMDVDRRTAPSADEVAAEHDVEQNRVRYRRDLSDVLKVNIAMKMLQILGQIVRNSPGSLPGDVKRQVALAAYLLGLRTLTAALNVSAAHLDGFRAYLSEIIKERRAIHRMPELLQSDLGQLADQGIIHLTQALAYGVIRRTSQAVGMKELQDIYAEILAEHTGRVPIRLIDLSIKLDYFSDTAPEIEIYELDDELHENYFAHNTLRELVFTYLYLTRVDYRIRQRLTSKLRIGEQTTKLIDNPNKRKHAPR